MDADTGCPVDILIDFSEPPSNIDDDLENKENFMPLTDSIEITRRESLTLSESLTTEDRILQDVTEKCTIPKPSDSNVELIQDEIFDFDLPVSPSERLKADKKVELDDDEEVFFGPMGFTEKCIAAGVMEGAIKPVSPLKPDQMAEIAKEAFSIAHRIANLKTSEKSPAPESNPMSWSKQHSPLSEKVNDNQLDLLQVPQRNKSDHQSENISPKSQMHSETLSKENTVGSSEKKHKRQGTFTKEESVSNIASACTTRPGQKENKATRKSREFPQRISHPASKLQRPTSRLMRFNKSQTNLRKAKQPPVAETVSSEHKTSDANAAARALPVARRSLQLPRATSACKTGDPSASSTNTRKSAIPKGPATKPQLMQPGQLQRQFFAAGRGKGAGSSQNGPIKAPAQPVPKMGDTVERPHNPALAAIANANNSQCPNTPAGQKRAQPKILSVCSDSSVSSKSSCSSSSVFGSTPGSTSKRLSFLPTPSKRRSTASSMPPPSPMSMSSSSSVSKHSLASSSDACDSPLFNSKTTAKPPRTRRSSGFKGKYTSNEVDVPGASPLAFKSRKNLVQNTPELPKRTMSRWSPLRRQLPVQLEDQVSMCTKRLSYAK